jgi:hypothetical protein
VSLSDQLADKGARHLMLLEALAAAGLLQELPADIVAGVLEDGERLAAVAALLQVGCLLGCLVLHAPVLAEGLGCGMAGWAPATCSAGGGCYCGLPAVSRLCKRHLQEQARCHCWLRLA